ncbi:protein Spindly-like [Ictidomys tridecemlineatus]
MEADIADLRSKLKEDEKERLKAAQYGLQLLESQSELQNQLDKCRNEMMTMTENLYESMDLKPSGNSGALEDNTYYTDLLQLKLENLNKENESSKSELSIQRRKALFESQRNPGYRAKTFCK